MHVDGAGVKVGSWVGDIMICMRTLLEVEWSARGLMGDFIVQEGFILYTYMVSQRGGQVIYGDSHIT